MKLWKLTTFLIVSILTFSGCVATSAKPKDVVDETLPIITLTQHGIVSDMKAIAFEWESVMKDTRVEGIHIYKKNLQEKKEGGNKLHETINNRFVTHYLDQDVKPDSEYSYVFKTFSKDADSLPSKEIIAKTLRPLDSVSWIHVLQEMPRSAKVIWRPHTNQIVKKYIIERKTLADDAFKELAVVNGRLNAEYIDTGLKDSHVYKYRILAVTFNDVVSLPSKEVKVLTKALPQSVVNIQASKNLPKQIRLTWNQVQTKDFSNYNVYRAESIDGRYTLVQSTVENSFIDNIAEDGKDYFYRVSMIDKDALESEHEKNSVHGQTLTKPASPSMVEVKMIGQSLEIAWKSNDPRVKSFVVEKKKKISWIESQTDEFVDIKGRSFVDAQIEPEKTYYYKVFSVDQFSIRSEASMEVKYTTTKTEGKAVVKEDVVQEVPEALSEEKNVVRPMQDMGISEL